MKMKRTCRDCRFAVWRRSAKGRIRPSLAGRCSYPPPKWYTIPVAYRNAAARPILPRAIWRSDTDLCPTFSRLFTPRELSAFNKE